MKIVLYLHIVHHNLHQSLGPMTKCTLRGLVLRFWAIWGDLGLGRRVLASISRRGFTAPDSPESPRYYASSPYGVVRPHHLGVFVTLRAGVISLPER